MNKLIAIILIVISFFVSAFSSAGSVIPTMFALIIVCILVTILATVWFEGEFRKRIINASKITIPLTFGVFISGYLFETLKVMF